MLCVCVFDNRIKKLSDMHFDTHFLRKKEYETEFTQFLAEKEVKSEKEEYNVARLNNLKEIVERVVLIKMTQKEIRFAQTQFEKKKKSTEKMKLKEKVTSELISISCIKGKMKLLNSHYHETFYHLRT
jgi:hypothetical protein